MATSSKPTTGSPVQQAILYPLDWLEERSGLVGGIKYFLFRKVPGDVNWFQTLGSATLTAFLVQAMTGVILAMYYKPDPKTAYPSIQHITNDLWAGWLVRGMHRWGASVFIILMFMHMGRVFLFGAYKYPRELNWIIGVLLLAIGLAEGFTGYLLPWDQTAYWATIVGININGTAPFLGPFLAQFLQGGTCINADTLSRFYAIHMLLVPGAIFALIGLHMYLVVRLGVTSPPWSKEAAGTGPIAERRPTNGGRRSGLTRYDTERPLVVPSDRVVERRRVFQQYKEDVKERGKPFFPYAMFHDTIMSLVVVVVIIGLAVVWKYSTPGDHHTAREAGWLGKLYDEPADPGTINFVPRPGLVLLLPLLPAPDLQVAAIGDPRHDRHPDDRARAAARDAVHRHARRAPAARAGPWRSSRRCSSIISMGVLTYKGATAKEALGSELRAHVPSWAKEQGFAEQPGCDRGREALRGLGLPELPHVSRRRRRRTSARPELTAEGAKNKGIAFQIAHLQCPCVREPGVADAVVLGPRRLARLTALADLPRSVQGPASSFLALARPRVARDHRDARARRRPHDVRPDRAGLRRR